MARETKQDIDQQVEDFMNGIFRLSRLASSFATDDEKRQMEGKGAVFVIRGLKKRYGFRIQGTEITPLDSSEKPDTFCLFKSPQLFLYYADQVITQGRTSAFRKGLSRGDIELRGSHTLQDKLGWEKAFGRLAKIREVYSR